MIQPAVNLFYSQCHYNVSIGTLFYWISCGFCNFSSYSRCVTFSSDLVCFSCILILFSITVLFLSNKYLVADGERFAPCCFVFWSLAVFPTGPVQSLWHSTVTQLDLMSKHCVLIRRRRLPVVVLMLPCGWYLLLWHFIRYLF